MIDSGPQVKVINWAMLIWIVFVGKLQRMIGRGCWQVKELLASGSLQKVT